MLARTLGTPDRWRRGTRRGAAAAWIVLALLVLGGGGFAFWFFVLRGGGPLPADLALVPGDASGFVSVRVADWWKAEGGRQFREMTTLLKEEDPVVMMKKEIGLGPEDIGRITVVIPNTPRPEPITIVATTRAYDRGTILKAGRGKPEEKSHAGRTYHVTRATALYFVDEQTMIFGSESVLKPMLGNWGKSAVAEPLAGALRRAAENHHVVAALVRPDFLRKEVPKGVPKEFAALLDLQSAVVVINDGPKGGLEATVTYPDASKAQLARQAADAGVTMAKAMLPLMQKDDPLQGPEAEFHAKLLPKLQAALDATRIEQKGNAVRIEVKSADTGGVLTAGAMGAWLFLRSAPDDVPFPGPLPEIRPNPPQNPQPPEAPEAVPPPKKKNDNPAPRPQP